MRKRFMLSICILFLFVFSVAFAEVPDVSQYSTEEIRAMIAALHKEASHRIETADTSPVSDFIYASNGKEIQINAYVGTSTTVVIPDEIDGLPVTRIREDAFRSKGIRLLELPSHLTYIGDRAFTYSNYITDSDGILVLPESIEHIGIAAFADSRYIGIVINSNCTIGEGSYNSPFHNMEQLEFVYIRDGANVSFPKQNEPFAYCTALKIVVIPASVSNIPDGAFYGSNLVKIITPAGSPAEAWAMEHFYPVETETYEQYVEYFEAFCP